MFFSLYTKYSLFFFGKCHTQKTRHKTCQNKHAQNYTHKPYPFSSLHIHFKLALFYKAPPKRAGNFGHSTRRTISLYVGVIALIVCIRMPVFGHLYGVLFEVVRSNGGVCHGPFKGWRTPWIVGCLWTPEALDPVNKTQ
jgi:hypothetical protein